MNLVFMGTPDFAVPCLDMLNNSEYNVIGVFTQPDKPRGRGNKIQFSPVKEYSLINNLPVFQPASLKSEESLQLVYDLNPDIIIVVAYGNILPDSVLRVPPLGCVNVHGSLLPKYRGAAPIQWAVINGDKITGVTTMLMDRGLDTGDILLTNEIEILPEETSGELFDRVSKESSILLMETLEKLLKNQIVPIKQDDSISSYAPMLSKELCPIDWNRSAFEIHNLVRGLNPWPVATTVYNGKKIKIFKCEVNDSASEKNGMVLKSDNELIISCKDKSIKVLSLQLEGKKVLNTADFLRGFDIQVGTYFN